MKVKDLKENARAMGFEDEKEVEELKNVFYFAVNQALNILSNELPLEDVVDVVVDHEQDIDFKEKLGEKFLSIESIMKDGEKISPFIVAGRYVHLKKGDYKVYYGVKATKVSDDEDDLEINHRAEHLISLLTAHYLWLDDDPEKAILYWNEYDDLKRKIDIEKQKEEEKRGKIFIKRGIEWLS